MNKDIQEKESQLMKSRSGRACIREGYQLFTSHFRRIFKITWPVALFFAVISATAASLPVLVSPALLWPAFGIEAVAVILLPSSSIVMLCTTTSASIIAGWHKNEEGFVEMTK